MIIVINCHWNVIPLTNYHFDDDDGGDGDGGGGAGCNL